MALLIALALSVTTYQPSTPIMTSNESQYSVYESQCLDIQGLGDADHLDLDECILDLQSQDIK